MDDLLSQKVELSELKKGDHVYTWRKKGLYSHHGIFIGDGKIGDGKIINFVQINKQHKKHKKPILVSSSESSDAISGSEKAPCHKSYYCGYEKVPGSGVRMSCIACFVRKSSLYRYKYNASNTFLIAKIRAGTCTTASSDPPEQVMHRVNYLYKYGYGEYDLQKNNCEDFALYCKTGLWSTSKNHQGRSSQANMVDRSIDVINDLMVDGSIDVSSELMVDGSIDVIRELTLGSLIHASLVPRLAMTVAKSIKKRKKNDLGNRKDVVKIDVEKLSSYI